MKTTYSYETFPGQVIVRTCEDGFEFQDLLDAIIANGEGTIVTEPGRSDERLESLAKNYTVLSLRMQLGTPE